MIYLEKKNLHSDVGKKINLECWGIPIPSTPPAADHHSFHHQCPTPSFNWCRHWAKPDRGLCCQSSPTRRREKWFTAHPTSPPLPALQALLPPTPPWEVGLTLVLRPTPAGLLQPVFFSWCEDNLNTGLSVSKKKKKLRRTNKIKKI